jgi:[ribosomal protein S5]-alanine N-acetyltransferase
MKKLPILYNTIPGGEYNKGKFPSNRTLYFTRLSMDGLKEMHEYSLDERLYEYFEFKPFKTIDDTEKYLNRLIDLEDDKIHGRTAMAWFVRCIEDNSLIGTARLVNIDYNRKSVEWGYGIDPNLWGEGYIFEIQELLKEYVFEKLKLNRLYGSTMVGNERVIASLKVAGCKHEGISRDYYCDSGGIFHDAWNYSMLASDYYTNKQRIKSINSKEKITKKTIANLIAKELNDVSVGENSDMGSISDWDSLSHIGIILSIEKETGLSLTPKEIAQSTSVENIYNIANNMK